MNHSFLDNIYEKLLNSIYSDYNLVNVVELEKYKEKLLSDIQYLPYLVRIHFKDEYTQIIYKDIEIYRKIRDNSESSIKDKSIEFIDWISEHEEYEKLLNKNQLEKLNKKIEEVETEINYLKRIIKKKE